MSGGHEPFVDEVDLKARLKAARIMHEKFCPLIKAVLGGKPPNLIIPKRKLANTVFYP